MPRRSRSPVDEQTQPTIVVAQGESVPQESIDVTAIAATILDEDPQARRALAEYLMILREWSLESRPDDGLAPDSKTEEP